VPVITATQGSSRTLTLADAIHSQSWTEKIDTPVGGKSLQALVHPVNYCSESFDSEPLEFRFNGVEGTMTIDFQQSLASDTSDGVAEVQISVDSKQSLIQFGFKDKKSFSSSLVGVNSVKVASRQPYQKGKCPGDLTILITQIVIS
jgi:hypothetical protein